MRCFSFAVVFLAFGMAYGAGQTDFSHMIRSAAESSGATYIVRRDAVVALGETALPWLAEAATDESAGWQERLTARICFERIARAEDIRELREHDWRQDPPFLPRPDGATEWSELKVETDIGETITYAKPTKPITIGGGGNPLWQHIDMDKHVVPRMKETGLWYHFLESYWKNPPGGTSEATRLFERWWSRDVSRAVVENEPEGIYPVRILIDKLERGASFASRDHRYDYKLLLDNKISDAVPVLVKRHGDYFQSIIGPIEAFPGSHNITFRGSLEPIMSFADIRHADIIEDYISRHPALAPLADRVAAVRARPAAQPLKDPPFRLGTEPASKVLERIAAVWEPAFRQAVPDDFTPTPANAVLDLRTTERLVWRVDGPLKSDLSLETRFFVQARKAARPEAWCSVPALHPGVRAVGLGEGALLVAHRAYGAKPDGPIPFGDQAALTVHRLERFSSDATVSDTPAMSAVFAGDTYGDSSVVAPTFEYPARKEIEEQLQGKSGSDVYRLSFKALATVEGSAQRQIARGEARGDVGRLRCFLREGNVEAFFARHHPIRDLGREGMTYWNGADWETSVWRDPDPPKPDPIPRDLDLDIQL